MEPSIVTVSIIEPPVRNTGIASSSSARPQSTPMPSGPNILCPENARRSTPRSATSTGRCGTDWQASRTTSAPTAWARSVSSRTGLSVPSTLETCVKAKTLVRSVSRLSRSVRSSRPSGVTGTQRSVAPVRRHASCHGMRLAWCSISVTSTSSPGPRREPVAVPAAAAGRAVGEGVGDEVDRLGGVAGEDDLGGRRPDEARDRLAGRLVGVGALLGELVGPAVHGGVGALVEVALGVEHLARLVRGRTRVEVDERVPPAHGARQDREVGPQPGQLLVGEGGGGHSGLDGLGEEAVVALGLEAVGELGAALLGDPAVDEDVHEVGLDVAQDARVVRDEQDAGAGALLGAVDALGDDPQRVDVEAGVGLVEDRRSSGAAAPSGGSRGASSRRRRSPR